MNKVTYFNRIPNCSKLEIFEDGTFLVDEQRCSLKQLGEALLKNTINYNQSIGEFIKPETMNCDCGAKHTSSPGMHADWCTTQQNS